MPKLTTLKSPVQERGHRTLKRILDATERLLDKKSFEEITVREILHSADVTVGSFYARFPTKEALFSGLLERQQATMDSYLLEDTEQLAGASLEDRVRFIVTRRVMRYVKHAPLIRTIFMRFRSSGHRISKKDRDNYERSRRLVIDFLGQSAEEITHPEPSKAIALGEFVVLAACRDMILFPRTPHASSVLEPVDDLIDELTRIYLAYLRSGT